LLDELVRCRQVDFMNEPVSPAASTDNDREHAEQERRSAEEHVGTARVTELLAAGFGFVMSPEAARNEAEQVRQVAEDARGVRDQQREALETIRQEQEQLRDSAETARAANEQNRAAAEAARHAVVDGVRTTADTLDATLEHMKVVEEMRRTLRDARDMHKLDSN
jgi:hypothetical protein